MTVPSLSPPAEPFKASTPLRIAVVQLCPKIGEVDANIAKARELCSKLQQHSIDLLCFPEMAFTGYVFDSADTISPYLEEPRIGPSSLFYQETAKRLGCHVIGGYPERLSEDEIETQGETVVEKDSLAGGMEVPDADSKSVSPDSPTVAYAKSYSHVQVGANSAILFGPSGQCIGGYRKTNLFETDMTWAKPGTGFISFPISTSSASASESGETAAATTFTVSVGICMDLNPHPPHQWTSSEGPFELAEYSMKNQSKLLVLLNSWLFSGLGENGEVVSEDEREKSDEEDQRPGGNRGNDHSQENDEPDWHTLKYWSARLRPLWRKDGRRRGSNETIYSVGSNESDRIEPAEVAVEDEEDSPPHETIVVVCNRTGKENGKTFAGSSAIFSMKAGSGRPKLLDMMGMRAEGVRVWNLLV